MRGEALQTEANPALKDSQQEVGRKRRRRLLRLSVVLVLVASIYVLRAPILRTSARFLITDEPLPMADYVLLLGADRCYEHAAELYHAGFARHILLIEPRPGRIQRMGILPSTENLAQRQLAVRGVPIHALIIVRGEARNDWEGARCLQTWLTEHPQARILALCDRFQSRRKRHIFDTILSAPSSERLRLRALPQRRYDETNWWQRREGVLDFFNSYVSLSHILLYGESKDEWRQWDPEEYEKTLR